MKEIVQKEKEQKWCGPWLLDAEILDKLDEIVKKAHDDFVSYETLRSSCHNKYNDNVHLEVSFQKNIKISASSFKEINISDKYKDYKPTGFSYSVEVMSNTLKIDLEGNQLSYYVCSSNENIEDKLLYEMKNIFNKAKPNKFSQITYHIGNNSWILFIFFCFGVLLMAVIISSTFRHSFRDHIKEDAVEILQKEELDTSDYNNLIRLLAELEFECYERYRNNVSEDISEGNYKFLSMFFVMGLLLYIICSISPHAIFAVGNGEKRIKFWRLYYKIIFYVFITIVGLPILQALITNRFFSLLLE